jgi:hypothetical protein
VENRENEAATGTPSQKRKPAARAAGSVRKACRSDAGRSLELLEHHVQLIDVRAVLLRDAEVDVLLLDEADQ